MNGITFEQRNVRAVDDARLYETLYEDGRLRGCEITYAGAQLTIARGVYMVRGRMVAIDNDEIFATAPTYTNGYGRLKITINLAASPSGSTFAQGSFGWQYASTNSFAALVQDDINGDATDYEIEICRVKYTSGSISEVVSQVGKVGVLRGILGMGTALITGIDLNGIVTPGVYYATAGLSVTNAPTTAAYKLIVLAIAPGIVMQFALSAAGRIYMRTYAEVWTSWTGGIEAVTTLPSTYNEGDVFIKV